MVVESFDSWLAAWVGISTKGKRSTAVEEQATRLSDFWCRGRCEWCISSAPEKRGSEAAVLRASRISCCRKCWSASGQMVAVTGEFSFVLCSDPRHLADPCMCPAAHLCLFALSSTCICTCVRRRHAYITMSCNSSRFFTCLRFTYCCRHRWVITVFLHSPSHVELCASSSNGFHVDGLRVTCPVVSAKRTKPMLFRAGF
mgnify:CR=1 FL=1